MENLAVWELITSHGTVIDRVHIETCNLNLLTSTGNIFADHQNLFIFHTKMRQRKGPFQWAMAKKKISTLVRRRRYIETTPGPSDRNQHWLKKAACYGILSIATCSEATLNRH